MGNGKLEISRIGADPKSLCERVTNISIAFLRLHFALPPSENPMADHIQTGQLLANKAEKKLFCCCALFGSNYQDAAELFLKSAKSFKLGKSWDKAGSIFIKSAKCHIKLDNKFDAAKAYVDASHCYKKTSTKGAITCLNQAVTIFTEIGQHIMAAKYCKVLSVFMHTYRFVYTS
ncbi:alpha-soluble NSF attachment protein [Trifolium repens]|nr:alpha-soluble NSF attachment protein [Trifolium repens]